MLQGSTGVSLPLTLPAAGGGTLAPGRQFAAVIRGNGADLWLALPKGGRVQVPARLGLQAGQPVRVAVEPGPQGSLQLRLLPPESATTAAPPGASAAGTAGAGTTQASQAALMNVLRELGALEHAQTAQRLLPRHMPQSAAAIKRVLSLFFQSRPPQDALATLSTLIGNATAQGALGGPLASAWQMLFTRFSESSSAAFDDLLRRITDERSMEARLAAALRGGRAEDSLQTLRGSLRGLLQRLRDDAGFQRFLQQTGGMQRFEQAVTQLLDRFSGQQLQNLHSLDQQYVFLELPLLPGGAFEHAHVHLLDGDGGSGKQGGGAREAVLDLETTHLGPLWVQVQSRGTGCQCVFRAERPATARALREHAEELEAALREAGYADSRVQVSTWDGDRLREVAALMQRYRGTDLRI